MPVHSLSRLRHLSTVAVLAALIASPLWAQEKRTLTFADLMRFRQVESPSISKDGRWIALAAEPDRGDGEVIVHSTDGEVRHAVPLGAAPIISADGRWVAMRLEPTLAEREKAEDARPEERPRAGLALLATGTGDVLIWDEVERFGFSSDGGWLARLHFKPREEKEDAEAEPGTEPPGEGRQGAAEEEQPPPEGPQEGEPEEEPTREKPGTSLVLRNLSSGDETTIEFVRSFAFDEQGRYLAYVVATPTGEGDGIFLIQLGADPPRPEALDTLSFARIGSLAWWEEGPRLAWVSAAEDTMGEAGPGSLRIWDAGEVRTAVAAEDAPEGWELPANGNRLSWSEDGERLFFGYRPERADEKGEEEEIEGLPGPVTEEPPSGEGGTEGSEAGEEEEPFDPYDLEVILEDRGVDVWHTDDPLIMPNQKQQWKEEQERTYTAVYHVGRRRAVQLSDTLVQVQDPPDNPRRALGVSTRPYLKERTWIGFLSDLYVVSLRDGGRTKVAERLGGGGSAVGQWIGMNERGVSLSPGGRYVAYFEDGDWHLYDAERGEARNLTSGLDVPFYDLDNDYPDAPGSYGVGGWIEGDRAVLIHDKYDVWRFPTAGGEPVNLTGGEGRAGRRVLRVLRVDPEREAYEEDGWIHLLSFHELEKDFGFYRTRAGRGGLERLLEEGVKYDLVEKAEDADVLLYTREDYDEFPDLWVADLWFEGPRKVTDVNPQMEEFAWGTSELVEWTSDDGVPLQGVVIKPGNYEEGRRYPVLTYFYRFFSQRLHEFNEPVVNHRPSFPIYASDGYIVFLPDVRFEVGRPGLAAVKSVVPGVKKLVELGLADPDALGLHGHSWSGYTTSYIVTQTNIFAAAVAGAPVSNMTSAYGGIRWGTGLARQFQYEMSQSRIGASLWEDRSAYIENSPLFYADRIETPLVIMHGDEDEAVPWYQSIELYLALRRLGKDAVFLQYRGEPHHPRKYANKLDYSIRMKEFFDHFLKGAPAPAWWVEGVPYRGK